MQVKQKKGYWSHAVNARCAGHSSHAAHTSNLVHASLVYCKSYASYATKN